MRKHGGTPSRRDKHVTPAAISPPGIARGWAAPRAAAQRRGHVALPMDTCGDTLPPGTHGPGGRDDAFPKHMRERLKRHLT